MGNFKEKVWVFRHVESPPDHVSPYIYYSANTNEIVKSTFVWKNKLEEEPRWLFLSTWFEGTGYPGGIRQATSCQGARLVLFQTGYRLDYVGSPPTSSWHRFDGDYLIVTVPEGYGGGALYDHVRPNPFCPGVQEDAPAGVIFHVQDGNPKSISYHNHRGSGTLSWHAPKSKWVIRIGPGDHNIMYESASWMGALSSFAPTQHHPDPAGNLTSMPITDHLIGSNTLPTISHVWP